NGPVMGLVPSGTSLLAWGTFTSAGTIPHTRAAAIDLSTAGPLGWYPDPNGNVAGICVASGHVCVGGAFTQAAGERVDNLAVFPLAALLAAPPIAAGGTGVDLSAAPV